MRAQPLVVAALPALLRGVKQHDREERWTQSAGEVFFRWIYGWLDGWIDGYKTKFSTFQAGAKLDLGLRAGQKLREMARRGEEEEEVKTKVNQIILLDIPQLFDFNKRWRHFLLTYFLRNI